jgi:hypothetical protein
MGESIGIHQWHLDAPGGKKAFSVEKAVTCRQMQRKRWCIGQPLHLGHPQCRDEQPEPGDGDSKRVDVDSCDLIESATGELARVCAGFSLLPSIKESPECTKDKVTRSASRIDRRNILKAGFRNCRLQCAIENEFFDEFRRLQKGKFFTSRLRKILIEISEEPRVPGVNHEIVDQRTGIRIDLAAMIDDRTCAIRGRPDEKERIVALVEERRHGRQALHLAKAGEQVLAIRCGRLTDEELIMAVARLIETGTGTGDPRLGQEKVVLQEANEDASQDPMDSDLGQALVAPCAVALPGSASPPSDLVLGAEWRVEVGVIREAAAEIVF